MIKTAVIVGGLLFLVCTLTAAGQSDAANHPGSYTGKLRNGTGGVVRFDSEEMKRRATHKADIGDLLKPTDFKGTAVVDVVIGTSGQVVGVKTLLDERDF
jgi:hypothetical protein